MAMDHVGTESDADECERSFGQESKANVVVVKVVTRVAVQAVPIIEWWAYDKVDLDALFVDLADINKITCGADLDGKIVMDLS
jgi:hypothetical protein